MPRNLITMEIDKILEKFNLSKLFKKKKENLNIIALYVLSPLNIKF